MALQPPDSRKLRPARTIIDKFVVGFTIAKIQAEIAKLKRFDLKDCHARIGEAVISEAIDRPTFRHLLDRFKSCEQQVQRLEGAHKLPADAQVSEKGVYVAARAKAKVQIEKLRLQQKSILVEIGELFSQETDIPESFANDVAHANTITAKIAQKEAEVLELKTTVSAFFRHPLRVAGALIALFVIYNVWSQASSAHSRWKANQREELAIKELDGQIKKAEAESRLLDLEYQESRIKAELDRKIQDEREKTDRIRREEEQKAALEREKELLAVRMREEALAQERARVAEQEARAAREASITEEARNKEQAAQAERALLAERLLSEINLYPTVYLSGSLMAGRVKVEFVGRDLDAIRQAQKSKDWLKMLSLINGGQPYTSYPSRTLIEGAASSLKHKNFSLILRTTKIYRHPYSIQLVTFYQAPRWPSVMRVDNIWKRHPDGIGYIADWTHQDGDMIMISGEDQKLRSQLRKFDTEANRQLEALGTKLKLGEFSEEEYLVVEKDLRLRVLQAVRTWAEAN